MTGDSTSEDVYDMAMRRMLVNQIQAVRTDEAQARIAEAMYRCHAGSITWATRISYWVACQLHGEEKTALLFTRFLLHARRVEKQDYIQRIIDQVGAALLAGKLDARQIDLIRWTVEQSSSQLPENG